MNLDCVTNLSFNMKNKIKSFFKKHPSLTIKSKSLAKHIEASEPHKYAELKAVLYSLTKEGFLRRQGKRYSLKREVPKSTIGTLQILNGGAFGFVIINEQNAQDIFITGKNLGTAFNGDKVEVSLFAKQKGKNLEGEIVKIVERKIIKVTGTLSSTGNFNFVTPEKKKVHRDIYIHHKNLNQAKNGDKVVVNNIVWEEASLNPEGNISKILGKAGSYNSEIAAVEDEMDLPREFPKAVLNETESFSETIPKKEISQRLDLRNEMIITIDPDDAKDFDDAVSLKILPNKNYEIGIHIADVSHYVTPKTKIYKEALKRGTSIYLVGKVIPMLPEKLSNQICSLVPSKDRLTFSVILEMTPRGRIVSHKIKKTIINSKRRFTYKEVQQILENGKGEHYKMLGNLNKVAKILRKKRNLKGSINFTTPEINFVLDENLKPVNTVIKEMSDSNQLIEEFMLLANKIIASEVNKVKARSSQPFIYRIHDVPNPDKLDEFAGFVKPLGYFFNPGAGNTSQQLRKLLDDAKGKPEEAVINVIAIRSMAKAIYSTDNIGHYGLGFPYYTHFTSPIRRFPDLIIHQLIFDFIKNGSIKCYNLSTLKSISESSSAAEKVAVTAERLSIKLKQIEYLEDKIGQEFEGVISGVTNFGLFIELEENLAEGLIHIRNMQDDYYVFEEKKYRLRGKVSGKKYRLGDKVIVKLIRVSEEKKEIDFSLLN